ncbi:kinetochore Sim4 complex subunit FTA2-domain-containing protein [Diaporthe sp. PMI_573]|nr:kinetochore Sim4 complex subunit FTA2-domain-containing protein [Diaporthaceae sp. PMI_573]
MPLKRVIYYTDPFFAECRAYGRIEEAVANKRLGIKDQSAVKCHGYIYLGDKDMRMLERMGLDLRTEVLDVKLRRALDGGGRVRAIVKDLAPSHTTVNSRNIRVSLSRVRKFNELQIYNRDIRADNFIGGKVVDFGSSWTEPHIILDALEPDDAEDSRLEDLVMFDDMIEEEKIKTRPKLQALHNVDVEHQKELKLRKKSKCRQTVKG